MNRVVERPLFTSAERMISELLEDSRYHIFDSIVEGESKRWRLVADGKFSFVLDLYTHKDRDFLNISVGLYKVPEESITEVALDVLSINDSLGVMAKFGRQDDILTMSSWFPLDSLKLEFIKALTLRFVDTAAHHTNKICTQYELVPLFHANGQIDKLTMN